MGSGDVSDAEPLEVTIRTFFAVARETKPLIRVVGSIVEQDVVVVDVAQRCGAELWIDVGYTLWEIEVTAACLEQESVGYRSDPRRINEFCLAPTQRTGFCGDVGAAEAS